MKHLRLEWGTERGATMASGKWAPEGNRRAKTPIDMYELFIAGTLRSLHFREVRRVTRRDPETNRDLVQFEGHWVDLKTANEMRIVVEGALAMGRVVFGDSMPCSQIWTLPEEYQFLGKPTTVETAPYRPFVYSHGCTEDERKAFFAAWKEKRSGRNP